MLKNHVVVALRALRRHPGYAFINIVGLGLGIAAFAVIMLFVGEELSYDSYHDDADRIYRVAFTGHPPNSEPDYFAVTSTPVGRVIRADYPEVESVVRIRGFTAPVTIGPRTEYEQSMWFAEPDLFDVFTIPLLEGSRDGLLEAPGTMVVTESTARRLFGAEDAVGRTVVVNDTSSIAIQGVIADFPSASHFRTDYIVSWATLLQFQPEGEAWLGLGIYTYVKLLPGVDPSAFGAKIRPLIQERFAETLTRIGFKADLTLEPLTDIYLKSKLKYQIGPVGDQTQVWVFAAIALFVLLLAVINFTNLATARSMDRAREVGVRKVAGSTRAALVAQFLSESVVLALFSLVVAVGLILVGVPLLNALSGKAMGYGTAFSPANLAILVGLAVASGLLGGLYPAAVLSGLSSVSVLKGSFHATPRGALLRKGLVSLQFAVSIGLIAGTGFVTRQLDFMRSQDLGFDDERVLVVDGSALQNEVTPESAVTLRTEFERQASVSGSSISGVLPGRPMGRLLFNAEGLPEDDARSALYGPVGYAYFENLGIPLVAGRSFSADFPGDRDEAVIVTRMMVDYLGWGTPDDAIGKTMDLGGGERRVVGVVEDYHQNSLRDKMEPLFFMLRPANVGFIALRLGPGDPRDAVAETEATWNRLFAGTPFTWFFLDQDYNRQYEAEDRLQTIASLFALLAVFIACLGLIGLAAFTAQQRRKEVGMRKVLGASTPGLVSLLSREFATLVGVGAVIAIPVTVWGMHRWLSAFPYSISLEPFTFAIAGLLVLVFALMSVGYQAVRVALANPVESLRYE